MPITYLDNQPSKKITYLDDEPKSSRPIQADTNNPKRVQNVADIMNRVQLGQQSQIGGGLAVLGEGLGQQGENIANFVGRNAPEFIKKPLGYAAQQASQLGTNIGENLPPAAQEGIAYGANKVGQGINYLNKNYPVTMSELKGAANIGNTILAAAPIGKATEIGLNTTNKLGQLLEKSGDAAKLAKRENYIQGLISPRETSKIIAGQNRVEKGWNRKQVIEPTQFDKDIAASVSQVKDVKKGNSLLGNENVLKNAYETEAKQLRATLEGSGVKYKPLAKQSVLNEAKMQIAEHPLLVGDSSKVAKNVITKAQALINEYGDSPAGLLKARQELDKWALSKQSGVFEKDNILSASVREARKSINNYIQKTVPDTAVKESLKKQFHYKSAVENIAEKRAREATTRLGRAAQKAKDSISLKGALAATAAGAGVGGAVLAGATSLLPMAGAGYAMGKILASPTTRQVLGKALQAPSGKTIGKLLREERRNK